MAAENREKGRMELTWYLADLITKVRIEGTERSVAHLDLRLVRAGNAAEAYDKAFRIGGARILFRSQSGISEEEIQHVVTPRDYLRAVQAEGLAFHGGDTIQ